MKLGAGLGIWKLGFDGMLKEMGELLEFLLHVMVRRDRRWRRDGSVARHDRSDFRTWAFDLVDVSGLKKTLSSPSFW